MNLRKISSGKLHLTTFLLMLIITFNLAKAQTRIGVKAGLNFSNVMAKDERSNKQETQIATGFLVGLTADIPVSGDFFIQPGIQYVEKGFKQKKGGYYGLANNFKVNVSYVEVPVNILYKPQLGNGKLLLGAGPYFGYGTGGTWKSDNVILMGDIMTDSKGEVIFKNDVMDGEFGKYMYGKPFDYGANFLAGYEFLEKLAVQFNAQLGLANLQPKVDGVKREGSLKNVGFGISVGYRF
uniref:porin family protein n=1 Tax=Pedobacter schmidteae TaxID=2201271 RepID=UPI0013CF0F24|nr:porin family protein [Pedobacter schmidteae]